MILSDLQHRIKSRLLDGEYFTTAPLVEVICLDGAGEYPEHQKLLETYCNREGCLVVIENCSLANMTWQRDELTIPIRIYENASENRLGDGGTRKHPRDVAWQIKLMIHGWIDEDEPDAKFRVMTIAPQSNSDGLNEWLVEVKTEISTEAETQT